MAFTRSAARSRLVPPNSSADRRQWLLRRPQEGTGGPWPRQRLGALALGALAVGALAIGALAIGRLRVLRADADTVHLGKLEIDDLTVKRLRVIEHAGDDLA